jgi:uncharacterized membrane protein
VGVTKDVAVAVAVAVVVVAGTTSMDMEANSINSKEVVMLLLLLLLFFMMVMLVSFNETHNQTDISLDEWNKHDARHVLPNFRVEVTIQ